MLSTDNIFTRRPWLLMLLLAVVTVVAYGHLFTNDFVHFDDYQYIMDNRWVQKGLHIDSIRWAFSMNRTDGTYWHPMTWISLMLDHDLFGLKPAGYHLMNLAIHIASSLILFFVLRRMTGKLWASAFVAAVFALHPINVESVAWAVERKNVLSAFFGMLSIWAYARYVESPSWRRYIPVFLFLAVGLMAKSMLVSLPFVLLLLDYWPLRRFQPFGEELSGEEKGVSPLKLVLEKLPLLALSMLSVAVSLISVKHGDNSHLPPLDHRLAEATISYVRYLGKMVWPTDLIVFYPPQASYPEWQVAGAAVLLLAITTAVLLAARKCPWLPVGWFWYLAVMFPVSGLVRTGLWPAMADRFAYLPMLGILIMIAWTVHYLVGGTTRLRMAIAGGALLACALLAALTWTQAGHWKTSRTLFDHALMHGKDNFDIRNNYGFALFHQGRFEEALEHYRVALAFQPSSTKAHFHMGLSLERLGRADEAIAEYGEALRFDPEYAEAHNNLGLTLFGKGRHKEAKGHMQVALRLMPDDADVLFNLGLISEALNESDDAVKYLSEAARISPDSIDAHSALGCVLGRMGRPREAIAQFREVLKLDPNNTDARRNIEVAAGRI